MTGHIFIEGEIGTDVTAKTVRADISNYPQATEFIVHINSGGGDVYEGYQIGSILKNLGKPTYAHIGAMCASIATAAAMSCDKRIMTPQGDFMIHLPTGTINGTAEDLRRGAEQLDRIKAELISMYLPKVAKKGVTKEQLSAMIEKETSMSPTEAYAMGFIDDVQDKMKAVAKLDYKKFTMENTFTKEQAEGMFKSLGEKIDTFLNKFSKVKNSVQLALADGTMVESSADAPEAIVGSQITLQDGTVAPDGSYETADGYVITIAGGVVTAYDPAQANAKDETAALKEEIAALKAQLEAKTNEANQAVEAKATVEQSLLETKNALQAEFKNLKTELETIKKTTFGDTEAPAKNEKFQDKGSEQKPYDPMVQWFEAYKTSRF